MRQTYVAAAALFIALSSSTSAMAVFFYPMQERFEIRPQPVYPAQRPYLAPVQRMFFPPRTIPRFGRRLSGVACYRRGRGRTRSLAPASIRSRRRKLAACRTPRFARERATTNPAAAAPTLRMKPACAPGRSARRRGTATVEHDLTLGAPIQKSQAPTLLLGPLKPTPLADCPG